MAAHDSFPFFYNNTVDNEAFLSENLNQSFNQQQRPEPILAPFPPSMFTPNPNGFPDHSLMTDPLSSLMEKQNQEIDQYLRLQNEHLIFSLNMQTKQHMMALLAKLDSEASVLLRWKEEELANANMRAQALQDCVNKAEEEKEMWKKMAHEKEALILSLKATLARVQESCFFPPGALGVEDGYSCYRFPGGRMEGNEQAGETDRVLFPCKACGNRGSCILFFPCQHLCACKECEASLNACPLCGSEKIDSLEVFMV